MNKPTAEEAFLHWFTNVQEEINASVWMVLKSEISFYPKWREGMPSPILELSSQLNVCKNEVYTNHYFQDNIKIVNLITLMSKCYSNYHPEVTNFFERRLGELLNLCNDYPKIYQVPAYVSLES